MLLDVQNQSCSIFLLQTSWCDFVGLCLDEMSIQMSR